MIRFFRLSAIVTIILLTVACKRVHDPVEVQFVFEHYVNGWALQLNSMQYVNTAGNHYQVDELQYFISEIKFHRSKGLVAITADSAIHYIDLAIPGTLTWNPEEKIPYSDYDSISFVFGINQSKNKTGLFVNPPERDMFWPELMGGGYHYMKMNGKWVAAGDTVKAFNFHLGIGMEMAGMQKTFVQNYFTVKLPLNFSKGSRKRTIMIRMNIEKWFDEPHKWDWNLIGGHIMQNQQAMRNASENGKNAFETFVLYDE